MLLAVALAWGNCVRCTDLIPVQTRTHGCCDTEQTPPLQKDCAGKTVDFDKAIQQDAAKPLMAIADAGPVTPLDLAVSQQAPATVVDSSLAVAHFSPLAASLRI